MTPNDVLERPGYRHEARFYAGLDGFLDSAVPFLREGMSAGEPALVAAPLDRLDALRDVLGADPDGIDFVDMALIGRNPACIIAAWHGFVEAHRDTGAPLRGIGEPIFPARTADELGECQRHEALLNLAFPSDPPLWLVCPYDTTSLDPAVIVEAHRSHPHTSGTSAVALGDTYDERELRRSVFAGTWPQPPGEAMRLDIDDVGQLAVMRQMGTGHAHRLGLAGRALDEFALLISELISNTFRHGFGRGVLYIWREHDRLVCQTRNRGLDLDPMVGRLRPPAEQRDGRGLWIVNQLCDLVEIRCADGDVVITAHRRLAATPFRAG